MDSRRLFLKKLKKFKKEKPGISLELLFFGIAAVLRFGHVLKAYMQLSQTKSREDFFSQLDCLQDGLILSNPKVHHQDLLGLLTNRSFQELSEGILPDDVFGLIRDSFIASFEKKLMGVFYTPPELAEMLLDHLDEPLHTYKRIFDPSCGCGSLLCVAGKRLLEEGIRVEEVSGHLFGMDLDPYAVLGCRFMLTFQLGLKDVQKRIVQGDSLKENPGRFDLLLINPPYVGKREAGFLFASLPQKYLQIAPDKGDFSYCFIMRAEELLNSGGRALILTSRYLIEAKSAKILRKFICEALPLQKLTDFYGLRVTEWQGVDPAMLLLGKKKSDVFTYMRPKELYGKAIQSKLVHAMYKGDPTEKESFTSVSLSQELFSEGTLHSREEEDLIRRERILLEMGEHLSQSVQSFQGIITGCDPAFIRRKGEIEDCFLPFSRPWIKGKDVNVERIEEPSYEIIYLSKHAPLPSGGERLLLPYKERLVRRREVKRGLIPWYALQWERDLHLFLKDKIIWPYKAKKNNFCVDRKGTLFSADVYGMVLKENSSWSLDLLALLLNTEFYERLYHVRAKKLGFDLYEYYPNTLLKLPIPQYERFKEEILKNNLGNTYDNFYTFIDTCDKINRFGIQIISDEERMALERFINESLYVYTDRD